MKKLFFALILSLSAFSLSAANTLESKTPAKVLSEKKQLEEFCTITEYFYDGAGNLVCTKTYRCPKA